MFSMLAAVAEFENELRKERQIEGIARAKKDGVQFGRKSKLTPELVAEMRQKRSDGLLIKDLMAAVWVKQSQCVAASEPD